MEFILASASPRRYEILTSLGLPVRVAVSDVNEDSATEDPARLTEELAKRKAEAVANTLDGTNEKIIIACDTVVICDGTVLGKPRDEADATRMLRMLSGRTHSVVSGICVISGNRTVTAHEETVVKFLEMTDTDVKNAVSLGEPLDKAGAYAIQGIASLWIEKIEGDYFNVVGLPVNRLSRVLREEFGTDICDYIKTKKEES
jgi:septum formation protein